MALPPIAGRTRPYSVSGVFPALDRMVALLPVLQGVDRRELVDLPRALQAAERAGLAQRIRAGTDGLVDPRAVVGYWDVASRYGLLVEGADHALTLTRRGGQLVQQPTGRVARWIAGREGLTYLLGAVAASAPGGTTLARLLPGWRDVLAGNRRFAAPASHARSLGQRVATLVRGGWLAPHGEHASRLADEAGFRKREPEPAFADLGGGLQLTPEGERCLREPSSTA